MLWDAGLWVGLRHLGCTLKRCAQGLHDNSIEICDAYTGRRVSLWSLGTMGIYLGLDFGTSGARLMAIDEAKAVQLSQCFPFSPAQCRDPWAWRSALENLLGSLPQALAQEVAAIALNGTSATVVLCDGQGEPVAPPLLYCDSQGSAVLPHLAQWVPGGHLVLSATSSLAKLVWWQQQQGWTAPPPGLHLLHQADWLAFWLHGHLGYTDYHNALKLGYDVAALAYPDWLRDHPVLAPLLPQVVPPGTSWGPLVPALAQRWGFPPETQICAGTTDSIGAFLASGATEPGQAVTSLGSTLVVKLLSRSPVEDNALGIYSHRLGDRWLVGGASNTGGAVLAQFFTPEQLATLSLEINPHEPSPLNYYPLTCPGERFPINDPHLLPCLTPIPEDPVQLLHGLLEGMARIEAQGYAVLRERGADRLTHVYTAGKGATNGPWQGIRQRCLGVPVVASEHTEAAYGTALLAHGGIAASRRLG